MAPTGSATVSRDPWWPSVALIEAAPSSYTYPTSLVLIQSIIANYQGDALCDVLSELFPRKPTASPQSFYLALLRLGFGCSSWFLSTYLSAPIYHECPTRKNTTYLFTLITQRVGLGLYQPHLDNLSCSGLLGAYG